jgi:hypothetical protein
MKALEKAQPRRGALDDPRAGARNRARRRSHQDQQDRDLRHRHPHLELGRLGAKTVPVPLITGHEFAGEIVELGRNVDGLHRSGSAVPGRGI